MCPDRIWISVEGAQAIQQALEKAKGHAARVLEEAARAGAQIVADEASRLAPRETGSLAENIEIVTVEKGLRQVQIAIGPGVARKTRREKKWFYGLFQEYGVTAHTINPKLRRAIAWDGLVRAWAQHPGHAARPFMRPALDGKSGAAQEEIADVLKRKLGL